MNLCEYNGCNRPAEWHRPQPVDGAYNTLCNMCCERIYHGHPYHKSAWQKIPTLSPHQPPPQPATTTEQPTLF